MASMDMPHVMHGGMHGGMNMSNTSTTMDPHAGHHMGTSTMGMPGGHEGHQDPTGHNHGNSSDPCSGGMMYRISGTVIMKMMPGMCMPGMQMFFHTGNCEYVLFEALKTTTAGEMVGACFAIFALAILYEGLKVLREYLLQKAMVSRYAVQDYNNGSASGDTKVLGTRSPGTHMISAGHFIQTLLHMLQVFMSYCLMLVFMTYNAWLCIAVVIGAGAGYFLFGWRKAIVVDINEHCH